MLEPLNKNNITYKMFQMFQMHSWLISYPQDLSQPMLEMLEMSIDDGDLDEERRLDVTEAIPDVELVDFRPVTRSIHVLSGA